MALEFSIWIYTGFRNSGLREYSPIGVTIEFDIYIYKRNTNFLLLFYFLLYSILNLFLLSMGCCMYGSHYRNGYRIQHQSEESTV